LKKEALLIDTVVEKQTRQGETPMKILSVNTSEDNTKKEQ